MADDGASSGFRSFGVEYQFVRTGDFDSGIGDIDIGNTEAHVLVLSTEYAFDDRWSLTASLPWIRKRHTGALPHNPFLDLQPEYVPSDAEVIDDGDYHSNFQDLFIGINYLIPRGRFTLQPMINAGMPSNDYPFYGHAAVGKDLWQVQVGSGFAYTPHISRFFFGGAVRYVFIESHLGVDVDHWLLDAEVGYSWTPTLSTRLFLNAKVGNSGLEFPDDYPRLPPDGDETWYRHDQITKHNFVNGGLGVDWRMNAEYVLSASALTMVRPDQVNAIEYAGRIGVTRLF